MPCTTLTRPPASHGTHGWALTPPSSGTHIDVTQFLIPGDRCRIRVIDTFGTEPAYNHEEYATLHGYRTNWGYWNLNPKQFMTMFRECEGRGGAGTSSFLPGWCREKAPSFPLPHESEVSPGDLVGRVPPGEAAAGPRTRWVGREEQSG